MKTKYITIEHPATFVGDWIYANLYGNILIG